MWRGALILSALLAFSCKPGQAKSVERDFCSDAAYRAIDTGCSALKRRAKTIDQLEAVRGYCTILKASQDAVCNEVTHEPVEVDQAGRGADR